MILTKPTLSDIDILKKYLYEKENSACAFSIGNLILWSSHYNIKYTIIDNMLVFLSEEEGQPSSFTFPMSQTYNYMMLSHPAENNNNSIDTETFRNYITQSKPVFDKICAYFRDKGIPLTLHMATPAVFEIINGWYPGIFTFTPERGDFDYIYDCERLANLNGSKLHGKRNHINNFLKKYPYYVYEDISEENIIDCLTVARKWADKHNAMAPLLTNDHEYEYSIINYALTHRNELNMIGGLIKIDRLPIAFTLGEPLCKDTFDVHFEKADDSIQGAYTMINREFVSRRLKNFKYINREEDMNLEGLRKAKLSYCPVFLFETGNIKAKNKR